MPEEAPRRRHLDWGGLATLALLLGVIIFCLFGVKHVDFGTDERDGSTRVEERGGHNYRLMNTRCSCGGKLEPWGNQGSYSAMCRKCNKSWVWETQEGGERRRSVDATLDSYFRATGKR